jgi:hypothetical protein
MGALDYLNGITQPTPNPAVTTSAATQSGLPDWYTQYIQGIAGQATAAGQAASQTQAPQQSVAGFTPDQTQAFQQVRNNQGAWQPYTSAAAGDIGAAAGAANTANAAVAGPAQTLPDNISKYMSPYTDSVVNEIARLGNQNFNENIMPTVNGAMIGSGQFGSERNADVLGRAARDTEQNILGQQAGALESGYSTAGTLFNADANRQQQQQQMQGSTALAGGALQGQAGQQMGALGSTVSQLGLGDAQAMQAIGQQQQGLQQQGLDVGTQNQQANANWDWQNLNNMSSLVRGQQLPSSASTAQSGPLSSTQYNPAPLSTLGAGIGSLTAKGA